MMTSELPPDTVLSPAQVIMLARGIQFLAMCDADHAYYENGEGFAKNDVGTGHALAETPPEKWSQDMVICARVFASKYRHQLTAYGLEALELSNYALDRWQVKQQARDVVATRTFTLEDGVIVIRSPYNPDLVNEIRDLPGRRWVADKKINTVPLYAIKEVKALGLKWGFDNQIPEMEVEDAPFNGISVGEFGGEVTIEVRFPFNLELVDRIKMVPKARWDKLSKVWRFPSESAVGVARFARENGIPVADNFAEVVAEADREHELSVAASKALEAELEIPMLAPGKDLRPFQKAGVAYVLRKRQAIIGDDVGLGKTVQALAALVISNSFPAIVICPKTAAPVWIGEVRKFFPHLTTNILRGTTSETLPTVDLTILNYDLAHHRLDDLKAVGAQALVLDEAHAIKNGRIRHACSICRATLKAKNTVICPNGHQVTSTVLVSTVKRTGAIAELASSLPKDAMMLNLSGTPVTNRVQELVNLLTVLRRIDDFGGAYKFWQRYCEGGTPERYHELHELLRANCMVRRMKAEVFTELPPVVHAVTPLDVPLSKMAAYQKAEDDVIEYLANRARELAEAGGEDGNAAYWHKKLRAQGAEHLVRISALKAASTEAKMGAVSEWLDEFLADDPTRKLVVFGENIDVVEGIAKRYGDAAVIIRGNVSMDDRTVAVRRFQTDPSVRVFVGNIRAAGEAITLTAASDVAFVQFPWTPKDIDQPIGRVFGRINDLHGATAHYLIAPNTIEKDIVALIDDKRRIVDAVTDDKIGGESTSILGDLLIRLAERGLLRQQQAA